MQRGWTDRVAAVVFDQSLAIELEGRNALQEFFVENLQLHPREVHAHASVAPAPKAMWALLPRSGS